MPKFRPVRVIQRSLFDGGGVRNRVKRLVGGVAALGLITNAKHWAVVVGEDNYGWRYECKRDTIRTHCDVVRASEDTRGFRSQCLDLGGYTTLSYSQIEVIGRNITASSLGMYIEANKPAWILGDYIVDENPMYCIFGSDCQFFVVNLLAVIIDQPSGWLYMEIMKRKLVRATYYVHNHLYQRAGAVVCGVVDEYRKDCSCSCCN